MQLPRPRENPEWSQVNAEFSRTPLVILTVRAKENHRILQITLGLTPTKLHLLTSGPVKTQPTIVSSVCSTEAETVQELLWKQNASASVCMDNSPNGDAFIQGKQSIIQIVSKAFICINIMLNRNLVMSLIILLIPFPFEGNNIDSILGPF